MQKFKNFFCVLFKLKEPEHYIKEDVTVHNLVDYLDEKEQELERKLELRRRHLEDEERNWRRTSEHG